MKKRIRIQISRPTPVFTLERVATLTREELFQLTSNLRIAWKVEGGLQPYYFAQTKKKVLVFTSPYRTLIERLEVIGETKRMFKDIPVVFDEKGMPRLVADYQRERNADVRSPQLLLRLAQ